MIDIEKPSSVSSQHQYLFKYQLKQENKEITMEKIRINVSIKYPIHFRYRKPHYDLPYKSAFVNRKPEFYFDCLNLKYSLNSTLEFPDDLLINGEFSKVMTRVNSKTEFSNEPLVHVPNGDLHHLILIIVITLFITVGSAIWIGIQIIRSSKNKNIHSLK